MTPFLFWSNLILCEYTETGESMKKIVCCLLIWMMSLSCVEAEYYIVMSDDERVIASENEHVQRSIASTSKIMTAILCLEYGDYTDQWMIGDEVNTVGEKRIYLQPGQQVSMRSLLYGLMLESGNDAAVALAKRVGGSVEKFVEMMNEKAKELGMHNTHFSNPHGLDTTDEGNLSTCFDMALLMKYAILNEQFCEILCTLSYTSEWGSVFHNSNRLLKDFPFTLGAKTGYTSKAGRTLVSAAKNQNLNLICVTFDLYDHFAFHQSQYIQAFQTMKKQVLLEIGEYSYLDYIIHVDEVMSVTCSDEELQEAEIRYWVDEDAMIFQFKLDDYIVSKSYKMTKKKTFCLLRWCV